MILLEQHCGNDALGHITDLKHPTRIRASHVCGVFEMIQVSNVLPFVCLGKKKRRRNILFIFMIDSFHEQQHEKPKLPNDACLVETPGTQTV